MKALNFAFALLLIAEPSYALVEQVSVSGVIRSFDGETVVLQQGDKRIKIPRKLIPKDQVRTGKEITVVLRNEDIHIVAPDAEIRPKPTNE